LKPREKKQPVEIKVEQDVLFRNKEIALENEKVFKEKGVYVLNIMASPGAGKTTFILSTLDYLSDKFKVGVIEGDIASKVDADRIKEKGVSVVQINTGGACHLESRMVRKALSHFDLDALDILIIENVGNLVCPAEFPLGEKLKVTLLSIPEGDDKPEKYPLMFSESDVVLLTKIDLLPLLNFDLNKVKRVISGLNPSVRIMEVSALKGDGMEEWFSFLQHEVDSFKGG
jgi:hydrogenase nickel incorporation protein HypB